MGAGSNAKPTLPPTGPKHSVGSVHERGVQDNRTQLPQQQQQQQQQQRIGAAVITETLRAPIVHAARTALARTAGAVEEPEPTPPDRRLIIFNVLAKCADGQMRQFRVMADSGSTGEFISTQAAKRGGWTLIAGNFGSALEAFGNSTALTQRVQDVQLSFTGERVGSGLAALHTSTNDFTVAPLSGYDILLGTRFQDAHRAVLHVYDRAMMLRGEDGQEVRVQGFRRAPEAQAHDTSARAVRTSTPGWAQLTRHVPERISALSTREQQNRRTQIARNAAAQIPGVITAAQFEHERREGLWDNARIFCMHEGGRHERETPELPSAGREYVEATDSAQLAPDKVCSITIDAGGYARTEVRTLTEPNKPSTGVTAACNHRSQRADQRTRQAEMCAALTEPTDETGDFEGLEPEEKRQASTTLAQLLAKYAGVMSDLPAGLPPLRGAEAFKIELKPGAEPKGSYGARMTVEDHQAGAKIMAELLSKGFIRPSRSPWGAPMFLVAKPDGTRRMVIDYRLLNAQTIRNRYPLPRVGELFDQLGKARYFSKIDLRTGYWQIRVDEGSVAKTAFTSRFGHYEWLVLPMGLTNAPAAFMSLMEDTFRDELNKFVLLFLDDILIYSDTLEEHAAHIATVLERLRDRKLFAKRSKCAFFCSEVEFLGHHVGRNGLRMVESKVASVQDWPTPTCQSDVEQFLGLAGYYRPFIKDLSRLAAPLAALTGRVRKGKGVKPAGGGKPTQTQRKLWHWGTREDEAFAAVKRAITQAPCLAIADASKPFVVHTDASGYATGAVLMQDHGRGLQPIEFMSVKMTDAQRNYPVHEQELLAITNALHKWSHHLRDRRFTVITDHQSLQYVESSKMSTSRLARWAMQLSDFDFDIRYERGDKNVVADALSRSAAGGAKEPASERPRDVSILGTLREMGHAVRTRRAASEQGHQAAQASRARNNGAAPAAAAAAAAAAEAPMSAAWDSLSEQLQAAALQDADYQSMLVFDDDERAAHGLLPTHADGQEAFVYDLSGAVVIPDDRALRTAMLELAHDSSGHQGRDRTYAWLAARAYWPGMQSEVATYVRGCDRCQRAKPSTQGAQGLPMSLAIPAHPWHTIGMDWIGPFAESPRRHDYVLVVVCKFGGGVVYIPTTKEADAGETLRLVRERVVAEHGWPAAIISDSDARFRSALWTGFWAAKGTHLLRSTAYHPQTDGITERANRTMVEALRACVQQNPRDWDLLLPDIQLAVNSSRNASTGFSPHMLTHGRETRTELDAQLEHAGVVPRRDQLYPGARELAEAVTAAAAAARAHMQAAQAKQRADSARGRRDPVIKAGSYVMLTTANTRQRGPVPDGVSRKLQDKFSGPYLVLDMVGSNAAKLRLPPGDRRLPTFNLAQLKLYTDGAVSHPGRKGQAGHAPAHGRDGAVRSSAGGAAAAAAAAAGAAPAAQREPSYEYINDDGEPVYDAESILRTVTDADGRWYQIKWRGWPESEATWQLARDMGGAQHLVQEFEAQQQQEEQAGVQPMDEDEAAAVVVCNEPAPTLAAMIRHPLAPMAGQNRQRTAAAPVEPLTERERNRAAARDTKPATGVRPAVNSKGALVMPSQRCTADTRSGRQCAQRTCAGEFCWVHLLQQRGLRIRGSLIPGAGKGLVAQRDFRPGDKIADYTGDIVPTGGNLQNSMYVLELSEAVSIDAARTNAGEGRWVNDAHNSGRRNNARFSCNQRAKTACLRATTRIRKGDEVLVSYGRNFWRGQGVARKMDARMEREPDAAAPAPAAAAAAAQGTGSKGAPIVLNALTKKVTEGLHASSTAAQSSSCTRTTHTQQRPVYGGKSATGIALYRSARSRNVRGSVRGSVH